MNAPPSIPACVCSDELLKPGSTSEKQINPIKKEIWYRYGGEVSVCKVVSRQEGSASRFDLTVLERSITQLSRQLSAEGAEVCSGLGGPF